MKNFAIVIILGLLVWFASAITRLENERYALELGMCGNFDPAHPETLSKRRECLDHVRTRTSAAYNLLYGLRII